MVKPVGGVDRYANLRRSARLQAKIAESAESVNGRKIEPPKRASQNSRPKRKKQSTSQELIELEENTTSQLPPDLNWMDTLKWLQRQRNVGLWIQCCRESCGKWRFNADIHDPVDVPEIWYCDMNSDRSIASCDCPDEERPSGTLIENKYNTGSIVWARLEGYPWWPSMVDDSPDFFCYYQLPKNSAVPVKYNVIFLQEGKVQRAWIPTKNIRPYKTNPKEIFLKRKKMKYQGISYKNQVLRACGIADRAIQMSIRERLENFSLVARWVCNDSTESQPQSSEENSTRDKLRNDEISPVSSQRKSAKRLRSSEENLTSDRRLQDDEISPVSSQRRSTRIADMTRAQSSTSGSPLSTQPMAGSFVSGTYTPSTAYSLISGGVDGTFQWPATPNSDRVMSIDVEDDVADWQLYLREVKEQASGDALPGPGRRQPDDKLCGLKISLIENFYPAFLEVEIRRSQNVSGIVSQAFGPSRACASGMFSQACGASRVFANDDSLRTEHSSGFYSQTSKLRGPYTEEEPREPPWPTIVDCTNATLNIAEDAISQAEHDRVDYDQLLQWCLANSTFIP